MNLPGPCPYKPRHHFDPISGWCWNHGCGWRDDGRSVYDARAVIFPTPDITEPRRHEAA